MVRIISSAILLIVACAATDTTEEPAEKCCYTSKKDCDGPRDWCSKDADQCTKCGGQLLSSFTPKPSEEEPSSSPIVAQGAQNAASTGSVFPFSLIATETPADKCCYSSKKDCDSPRDWCSKDADQCTKCGGQLLSTFTPKPSEESPVVEQVGAAATSSERSAFPFSLVATGTEDEPADKCCYSSKHDCDSPRDWCSKDADQCTKCGGQLLSTFTPKPSEESPVVEQVGAAATSSERSAFPFSLNAENKGVVSQSPAFFGMFLMTAASSVLFFTMRFQRTSNGERSQPFLQTMAVV